MAFLDTKKDGEALPAILPATLPATLAAALQAQGEGGLPAGHGRGEGDDDFDSASSEGAPDRDSPDGNASAAELPPVGESANYSRSVADFGQPSQFTAELRGGWNLVRTGLGDSNLFASLAALGNGVVGMRGADPEGSCDDSYAALYLAGGTHQLVSTVRSGEVDKGIMNEDLVAWQLPSLTFRAKGDPVWFQLSKETMLGSYRKTLDLKNATLSRTVVVKHGDKETKVTCTRIVSMADPTIIATQYVIEPRNWTGQVEVRSMIDGSIVNNGIARYRTLKSKHLQVGEKGGDEAGTLFLEAETRMVKVWSPDAAAEQRVEAVTKMAQAARISITGQEGEVSQVPSVEAEKVSQVFTVNVKQHKPVTVEQVVAVVATRQKEEDVLTKAIAKANEKKNCTQLFDEHSREWQKLWHLYDIQLDGPAEWQEIVRVHLMHTIMTLTEHSVGRDTSYPARGWTGETYRGHIFWDTLYILHLLLLRNPQLADVPAFVDLQRRLAAAAMHADAAGADVAAMRADAAGAAAGGGGGGGGGAADDAAAAAATQRVVAPLVRESLSYRFRRLEAARFLAQEAGYRGAMFPWQSGHYGDETTPALHANPMDKINPWGDDLSRRQRHVNAEIALEVWKYWQHTGDEQFMAAEGAELILSIAQFWASIATWDEGKQKYVINSVMGPDEYHEHYKGQPGVNNNSYTNIMVAWVMARAVDILESDIISEEKKSRLQAKLAADGIDKDAIAKWKRMSKEMFIPVDEVEEGAFAGVTAGKVVSQFEGHGQLEAFSPDELVNIEERFGEKPERMDRILKAMASECLLDAKRTIHAINLFKHKTPFSQIMRYIFDEYRQEEDKLYEKEAAKELKLAGQVEWIAKRKKKVIALVMEVVETKKAFDVRSIELGQQQRHFHFTPITNAIAKAAAEEAKKYSTDEYKNAKQADGLPMAIFALGLEKVLNVLGGLGYQLLIQDVVRSIKYAQALTYHGSTLSKVTFASVLYDLDRPEAMKLYQEALLSDAHSLQAGKTTEEGIHAGVMASTVAMMLSQFAGIDCSDERHIVCVPNMPEKITRLEFRVKHRALTYLVNIDGGNLNLKLEDGAPRATVSIYGKETSICLGETISRQLRFLSEDGRLVERTGRAPGMFASPVSPRRDVGEAAGGGAAYQGGIFAPPSPRRPGEEAGWGGGGAAPRNGQPIGTPERPRRPHGR